MDDFLAFLGYFIAEGSTPVDVRGPISLSQNTGEVATKMVRCLSSMGFTPGLIVSRGNQQSVSVCHGGLYDWLREECGGGSSNKRIPRFVFSLSTRQLKIILNALVEGDGSLHSDCSSTASPGSFTYSTTSEGLAGDVQELCFRLGMTSTAKRYKRQEGWHAIWNVGVHTDECHMLKPSKQMYAVPYTGKVHCFTMPKGTLVTRRNGKVLVSGNSTDYSYATAVIAYQVAEAQVFQPERTEFDEIINKTLMKGFGYKTIKFRSLPITMKSVEELFKGLPLVAEMVEKKDFVSAVNAALGTDLKYKEAPAAPEEAPAPEAPVLPEPKVDPHTNLPYTTPLPPGTILPKPGDSEKEGPKAHTPVKVTKSEVSTLQLLKLVRRTAEAENLVEPLISMTDADKALVQKSVDALEPETKALFDQLLSSYCTPESINAHNH